MVSPNSPVLAPSSPSSPSRRNLDFAFPPFAMGLPSVYERAGFEINKNRSRSSSRSSTRSSTRSRASSSNTSRETSLNFSQSSFGGPIGNKSNASLGSSASGNLQTPAQPSPLNSEQFNKFKEDKVRINVPGKDVRVHPASPTSLDKSYDPYANNVERTEEDSYTSEYSESRSPGPPQPQQQPQQQQQNLLRINDISDDEESIYSVQPVAPSNSEGYVDGGVVEHDLETDSAAIASVPTPYSREDSEFPSLINRTKSFKFDDSTEEIESFYDGGREESIANFGKESLDVPQWRPPGVEAPHSEAPHVTYREMEPQPNVEDPINEVTREKSIEESPAEERAQPTLGAHALPSFLKPAHGPAMSSVSQGLLPDVHQTHQPQQPHQLPELPEVAEETEEIEPLVVPPRAPNHGEMAEVTQAETSAEEIMPTEEIPTPEIVSLHDIMPAENSSSDGPGEVIPVNEGIPANARPEDATEISQSTEHSFRAQEDSILPPPPHFTGPPRPQSPRMQQAPAQMSSPQMPVVGLPMPNGPMPYGPRDRPMSPGGQHMQRSSPNGMPPMGMNGPVPPMAMPLMGMPPLGMPMGMNGMPPMVMNRVPPMGMNGMPPMSMNAPHENEEVYMKPKKRFPKQGLSQLATAPSVAALQTTSGMAGRQPAQPKGTGFANDMPGMPGGMPGMPFVPKRMNSPRNNKKLGAAHKIGEFHMDMPHHNPQQDRPQPFSGPIPRGMSLNGMPLSPNGLQMRPMRPMTPLSPDGFMPPMFSGMPPNGMPPNGMPSYGMPSNGMSPNGMSPNGIHGMLPNGTPIGPMGPMTPNMMSPASPHNGTNSVSPSMQSPADSETLPNTSISHASSATSEEEEEKQTKPLMLTREQPLKPPTGFLGVPGNPRDSSASSIYSSRQSRLPGAQSDKDGLQVGHSPQQPSQDSAASFDFNQNHLELQLAPSRVSTWHSTEEEASSREQSHLGDEYRLEGPKSSAGFHTAPARETVSTQDLSLATLDSQNNSSVDLNGKKVRKQCRGCLLPINGKSVRAQQGSLSGRWHRECFKCTRCDNPLTLDEQIHVLNDEPYCSRCYHIANNSTCRKCGEGVEGSCLETRLEGNDGQPLLYHLHCLRCDDCNIKLQHSYFDVDGSTFCAEHAFTSLPNDYAVHKWYTQFMMI